MTVRNLALEPASINLRVGETRQIEAVAVYSDGTSIKVPPVARFVSADPSVVDLEPFGLLRAKRPGKTVITATFDGHSAVAAVLVGP